MTVTEQVDLAIVGGGPAGMAAAIEARRAGVPSVCLLDEGIALGGQIFRRYGPGFSVTDARAAGHEYRDGRELIEETGQSSADIRTGTIAWGIWDKRIAWVRDGETSGILDARAIVLAPGARDRPVAFPGWTLPGVITAGAAKTLVAIQRVLPGRRIVMAGSGPLALAFSAQLRELGAEIVEVAEASPGPRPGDIAGMALSGVPSLLLDAARYRSRLFADRVPLSYSTIVVRVEGRDAVERVVLAKVDRDWRIVPGTERAVEADTVVLGYGLESSSELFRLIGCHLTFDRDLGGWIPQKDEAMRTSLPDVFAAGDGSGIGGSKHAIEEGRIAGIMAAEALGSIDEREADSRASAPRRRLSRLRRFRTILNRTYAVGPGLYELATSSTVICRCEERTAADLDALIAEGIDDPNVVRAQSRIGMGRCQGRNCASHVAATIARRASRSVDSVPPLSARPPVRPIPVAAIAEEREQPEAAIEVE